MAAQQAAKTGSKNGSSTVKNPPEPVSPSEPAVESKAAAENGGRAVSIEFPLEEAEFRFKRSINFTMNRRQTLVFNRIFAGLRAQHAMLANGKHVDTVQDVVRWWLDAAASEAAV